LGVLVIGLTRVEAARGVDPRFLPNVGEEPEKKGEKIDVDNLPKAVVVGVKKAMPGARITKAMKLMEDGKTVYYLDDVKVGKKGWDVTVSEEGRILKKEECHDDN
jgi:hypothetical protein